MERKAQLNYNPNESSAYKRKTYIYLGYIPIHTKQSTKQNHNTKNSSFKTHCNQNNSNPPNHQSIYPQTIQINLKFC